MGIGTATPAASAVLDLTSSTQGFLPPRIALTATNAASPLSSPVTGTVVYNNASAGTFPNQVTPGYYFWNGSIWTKIGNSGLISSNSVTVSATTTAPNLGTRSIDRTYAIDNGITKRIYLQLGFAGNSSGSGEYIFTLPSGVSFNTNAGFNPTITSGLWNTVGDMGQYLIPFNGGIVQSGSWNQNGYIVPYSSNTYRIVIDNNIQSGMTLLSHTWYGAATSTMINLCFDIW